MTNHELIAARQAYLIAEQAYAKQHSGENFSRKEAARARITQIQNEVYQDLARAARTRYSVRGVGL